MSKIFINGVALPNSEYNATEARWTRGYNGKIEGSTVGDRHQLSITTDSSRISATGFTEDQLDDIGNIESFQILPIHVNGFQLRLINPNSIIRPIPRFTLYRTVSGTSSQPFNGAAITSLKRNTLNSRVQRAVVLLQGAGGSGGTANGSIFAIRDAAGGGSGATMWILTDLYNVNSSSGISVGPPGFAPSSSGTGGFGGGANLNIHQTSGSTPSNSYTANGGNGGTSDGPNPPVGGNGGTISTSYNPFPFATILRQENGVVGGGTGSGGPVFSFSVTTGISGEFFGTYINTLSTPANNKNPFVTFSSSGGELGTVSLTGNTAKSGGTRPTNGGAGGAASRYGRGGAGKLTTSTSANEGLYGSGGGGGNGNSASPHFIGARGGGGFVVLFF